MKKTPTPDLFFDTITAYQKTAALKAAIDLDVFGALSKGGANAKTIARASKADERGVRILCDYLTIEGFLTKKGDRYALTPISATFLNRQSPAYLGSAADFLLSDPLISAFKNLTESVRRGGTAESKKGSMEPEHPMWVTFARAMAGMMYLPAQGLTELVPLDAKRESKVLDIAAGHGMWGLAFAKKYPKARVTALDWAPVLKVAKENAARAGVADRFSMIAGSAFDVKLDRDYDVILIPNFLHHFSAKECVRFLKRANSALKPGGRVAIVEFVPNPDRITPPQSAGFSLVMLATTAEGDAYTFAEYSKMLKEAGFKKPKAHPLPASMNQALIASK